MRTSHHAAHVTYFCALLSVSLFFGCDVVDSVNPKSEPTFWYVAKFQGAEQRAKNKYSGMKQALGNALAAQDEAGMLDGFSAISEHFTSVADQFDRLDTSDVDDDAVNYVQDLAKTYRDAGIALQKLATAHRNRDDAQAGSLMSQVLPLQEKIEQAPSERAALFTTLSGRYGGRNFNTIDDY